MKSPRGLASIALGIVLAGLLVEESPAFRAGVAVAAFLLVMRFGVLEGMIAADATKRWRRRLNVGFTVLLWIALQFLLFTSFLPADVFLPLAAAAGLWFLWDQPPGRLVDALYVGVVTLAAIFGTCRLGGDDPVEIVRAVAVAWILLTALARLDAERVLETLPHLANQRGPGGDHLACAMVVAAAAGLGLLFTLTWKERPEERRDDRGIDRGPVTGFSDRIRLGGFERLKSSDRLALVVRVREVEGGRRVTWNHDESERPDKPPLLLRGSVLDAYDRGGFSRSPVLQDSWSRDRTVPRGMTRLTLLQTIDAQPSRSAALFGLERVDRVWGDAHRDSVGGVATSEAPTEILRYEVRSHVLTPASRARLSGFRIDHPDERYVRLPRIDEAVTRLARDVVEGCVRDNDRVERIDAWLRDTGRFTYTRNNPNGGADPLARFLLETRAGHCEYFASAMVVMLRALGIPARVAVGFRGGTYSAQLGRYRVLENAAHAWVEVPYEGLGWVAFDPTPPETRLDIAAGGAGDSESAAGRGGPADQPTPRGARPDLFSKLPWEALGGLGLLLTVAGLLAIRFGRRKGRLVPGRGSGEASLRSRLLEVLTLAGAKVRPTATLRELAAEARWPTAAESRTVDGVVGLLYRSWYSGRAPAREEVQQSHQALRVVAAMLAEERRAKAAPLAVGSRGGEGKTG